MTITAEISDIIEASREAEHWPHHVNEICDIRKTGIPDTWLLIGRLFARLEESLKRWSGIIHKHAEAFDSVSQGNVHTPEGFFSSGHTAAIRYTQSFSFSIYAEFYEHQTRRALADHRLILDWGEEISLEEIANDDPSQFIEIAGGRIDEWISSKTFDPSEVVACVRIERARLSNKYQPIVQHFDDLSTPSRTHEEGSIAGIDQPPSQKKPGRRASQRVTMLVEFMDAIRATGQTHTDKQLAALFTQKHPDQPNATEREMKNARQSRGKVRKRRD